MGGFTKPVLLVTMVALSSCSCAPPQASLPAAVQCRPGADCDRKWSRATNWVSQNAFYPIQTRTDTLIQTSAPVGKSPGNSVTVYKIPQPDGRAEIIANFDCASLVGCVPGPDHLARTFVAYVSGESSLIVDIPRPDAHCRARAPLGDPLLLFQ